MNNRKILFLGLFFSGFFWANAAKAVCPVCVVAIGTCVGLSRWLGVDDTISGAWIGALLVAMILWTLMEMKKKSWSFSFDMVIVSLVYYLLIFVPLYYSGIIGHPLNKVFGIDKIIFGTAVGTAIFLLAHWFNLYLKNKNNGKVYFPYQKVVIPLLFLLAVSLLFHFIIGCQVKMPF